MYIKWFYRHIRCPEKRCSSQRSVPAATDHDNITSASYGHVEQEFQMSLSQNHGFVRSAFFNPVSSDLLQIFYNASRYANNKLELGFPAGKVETALS